MNVHESPTRRKMTPHSPQLSVTHTPTNVPNPRKRGRTACTRCKSRKQKCDNEIPVCSNCRRSGAPCDKADVVDEVLPASYTKALEDRVAFLEKRLGQLQNAQTIDDEGTDEINTVGSEPRHNALDDIVNLMSTGNFEAPAYVGSSSGLSLALNLGEMVQATVWNKSLPEASSPTATNRDDSYESSRRKGSRSISLAELLSRSAKEPPSNELGSRIINAYFVQLHARYPFLQPEDVWSIHKDRFKLAEASPKDLSREKRFGIFKLYLVYAIGATLLQLTEKQTSFSAESFYMAALQHISSARESRTVQNIEAMTLLVLYHLRTASSHGLWYMVGLAMRTCIDLGMHRKGREQNLTADTVDRRRRLFWSVYSLERTIAISLGRPLSISDSQIDVAFPDSDICSSLSLSQNGSPKFRQPQTNLALHLFRLRRIEASIHHSIYRVDKPLASLLSKLDPLFRNLEDWRSLLLSSLPASSPDLNYPLLHYHRAVRLLIQPFLPLLEPSDHLYARCLRAAGDICQTHKRLHQSPDYGHSFIAVQTVFVAGATLLYGLWTRKHEVWSVALADDIRACSLVLFVMSERASWVRRYRDAFEVLVSAAMGRLNTSDAECTSSNMPRKQDQQRHQNSESGNSPTVIDVQNSDRHRLFMADTGQSEAMAVDSAVWQGIASGQGIVPDSYAGVSGGGNSDAWPIVLEMANWIDQDGGTPIWMPDFETLQGLSDIK